MSAKTNQRQVTDSEAASDPESAPAWATSWAEALDDHANIPYDLQVAIENIAAGGTIPDGLAELEAPIVEMGTGTHLHAPDVTGDGSKRACSRGHQNGVEGTNKEHEILSAWRGECSDVVCQSYFDGLRAAGVIEEASDD